MPWCSVSQIQALNRTQPVLPMGLGYLEGVTHDYVRHGTTTLFAALDIATGAVFTDCKPRHRHQEFLSFLRRLDECIPEGPQRLIPSWKSWYNFVHVFPGHDTRTTALQLSCEKVSLSVSFPQL